MDGDKKTGTPFRCVPVSIPYGWSYEIYTGLRLLGVNHAPTRGFNDLVAQRGPFAEPGFPV
jgi:hypothetical protein